MPDIDQLTRRPRGIVSAMAALRKAGLSFAKKETVPILPQGRNRRALYARSESTGDGMLHAPPLQCIDRLAASTVHTEDPTLLCRCEDRKTANNTSKNQPIEA